MSVAASLIATTMNASTPLLLAALGILVAERSGVLNLGVEGIMLMAAIAGYMATVECTVLLLKGCGAIFLVFL